MTEIIGIYIRIKEDEIGRLQSDPNILPKYDPRVALTDGRGLDLGRAWEELGVFLDGGVKLPDQGPTVGEIPLPNTDSRATWSYVEPARVQQMADEMKLLQRSQFSQRYKVDQEDTLTIPGAHTGAFGSREQYMFAKLKDLAAHYAQAAEKGEAMLVRIGERI